MILLLSNEGDWEEGSPRSLLTIRGRDFCVPVWLSLVTLHGKTLEKEGRLFQGLPCFASYYDQQ